MLQLLKLPDGTVNVLVEGVSRARLKTYTRTEDFYEAEAEALGHGHAGHPGDLVVDGEDGKLGSQGSRDAAVGEQVAERHCMVAPAYAVAGGTRVAGPLCGRAELC